MEDIISIWTHRKLLRRMVNRDIAGRYRGAIFGLFWAIITPIFMLCVYTFVFTTIFKSRWSIGETGGPFDYAILLFVGLILHNLLAEVLTISPKLILSNKTYVKKVVFPLEILPAITIGTALFHAVMSLIVLLIFQLLANHTLPITALLFPLVLIPFLVFILGCGLILSSLGVFLRDISQVTRPVVTALLFLGPILYPATALPEAIRPYLVLNPLSLITEQSREVLLYGNLPDWIALGGYMIAACLVYLLGVFWFNRTKKAFADVL